MLGTNKGRIQKEYNDWNKIVIYKQSTYLIPKG